VIKPEPRASVLLVNDRPDQLIALATVLDPLQENLVLARSGEEALRQLLHHEFAVVLLDVHMPSLDGFETASLIRQRGHSRTTPIIFITAYGQDDEQVTRSYSLGAVDFIQTPIIPEILRTKVGVFVQLYKKSEELRLITEAQHQHELEQAQEKLEAETKRNLFFVLSIDLLAVTGFDGYFKQTNPAWEKILGWNEEELRSQTFLNFAHPEDREPTLKQLETLKQGTAITYFEQRFACKDGQYKWLGWTAAPSSADLLIYIFARDITERRLADEQIRLLNCKLQARINEVTAVNRELESFSYSISHDLRAPLRSIQGFAEMLQTECGSALPAAGQDYAARLVRSAAYMDQLLADLLEYSRLGQLDLPLAPLRLEPVVAEVLESLAADMEAKGAQVDVQEPLVAVNAHPATLKRMLSNLITNALKFVPPGTRPHVRVWTEERRGADGSTHPVPGPRAETSAQHAEWERRGPAEADGHSFDLASALPRVRLWIADNGIGVAPDQHEKIFGLFQRVHRNESYPGTGIGLAIVRKGAERMSGQAGVESQVGQGSRFWVDLPAAAETTGHVRSKAA
jgi:PAS domain S-box-containing protein